MLHTFPTEQPLSCFYSFSSTASEGKLFAAVVHCLPKIRQPPSWHWLVDVENSMCSVLTCSLRNKKNFVLTWDGETSTQVKSRMVSRALGSALSSMLQSDNMSGLFFSEWIKVDTNTELLVPFQIYLFIAYSMIQWRYLKHSRVYLHAYNALHFIFFRLLRS